MSRNRIIPLLALLFALILTLPVLAQDALPLTQTYTSVDGTISFQYPEGWAFRDLSDSTIALDVDIVPTKSAFRKDIISSSSTTYESGEARVNMIVGLKTTLADLAGVDSSASVAATLKALLARGANQATFDSITKLSINDHQAARVSFHAGQHGEGFVTLIDFGSYIGGAAVYAATGELAQWQATAEAIIGSLRLGTAALPTLQTTLDSTPGAALALTETFTSRDQSASVQYPAGWVKRSSESDEFFLNMGFANSEEALNRPFPGGTDNPFLPGEVQVQLFVADILRLMPEAPGLTASTTPVELLQILLDIAGKPEGVHFGAVETTSIRDLPAAQLYFDTGKEGEGRVLVVRLREGVMMIAAILAAPGELQQWEATGRAMLASVRFNPAPATPETTPPILS